MTHPTPPLRPLVDAIVDARKRATLVACAPQLVPADHASAYATQRAVAAALGFDVGGWKVGMLADGTPTAAPIYAQDIRASGASWQLPASGALTIEIELAMRFARNLPSRTGAPYTRRDVEAALADVMVGVEVLKSRFTGDAFPPPNVHLADNLGNLGYVTGGATRSFAALDLARLNCRYALGGAAVHQRVGGHPQDDPWAPVLACLNAGVAGPEGFRAGQVVTTGTLVPPFRVASPIRLDAALDGVGDVGVDFVR